MNRTPLTILRRQATRALSRQRLNHGRNQCRTTTVLTLLPALLAAGSAAMAQAPLGSGFRYQGQLKLGGSPLNATADFVFGLWDAEIDGNMIGSLVAVPNVTVTNGLFTVEPDFGGLAFNGDERWLEVRVRTPAGSGVFTTLSPRQEITPAPYAQLAAEAVSVPGIDGHSLDAADSDPVDALFVNNAGNVGIGTATPAAQLHLHKSSTSSADTIRLDALPDENPRIAFTVDNQVGAHIRLNDSANDQLQFTVYDTLGGSPISALSIATSGNVGIGVDDAQTLLALDVGPGHPVGVTQNQVAGASSLELTTSDLSGAQATRFLMRGNSDDGDVEFYRGARGAEQQTAIIDGATGYVGIGQDSPVAPVHVYAENEEFTVPTVARFEARQTPGGFDFHNAMDFTGNEINANNLASGGGAALQLNNESNGDVTLARGGGHVGIGTVALGNVHLHVEAGEVSGMSTDAIDVEDVLIEDASSAWLGLYSDDIGSVGSGIVLAEMAGGAGSLDNKWAMYRRTSDNVGDLVFTYGTNTGPTSNEVIMQLMPDGRTKVQVLEITGADLAERFPVSEKVSPGTVVEIDPNNPGKLRVVRGAYNSRVAGVVSGANDLSVGIILGNLPGHEDAPPIAMSGRVWTMCDASNAPIAPGDQLTTSDTPGHAMKVTDHNRAHGAIIGKAMTSLDSGKGLVLVLVTLQ